MSGHALELKSGANLNLDDLPELATVEMLDACCVCIFCLDGILNDSTAVGTPRHQRRKESGSSTVKSKPLKAAQIREGEKNCREGDQKENYAIKVSCWLGKYCARSEVCNKALSNRGGKGLGQR